VLEAGGRVDLPLRELLLQAAARDLAQRLHHPRSTEQGKPTRKGERGRSVESGGDPTSRAAGSGGGGLGFLTFREGDEEELVMARARAGRPPGSGGGGRGEEGRGRRGRGKVSARACAGGAAAAAVVWWWGGSAAPRGKRKWRKGPTNDEETFGRMGRGLPLSCMFSVPAVWILDADSLGNSTGVLQLKSS